MTDNPIQVGHIETNIEATVSYRVTGAPPMLRRYSAIMFQPERLDVTFENSQFTSVQVSGRRVLKSRLGETLRNRYYFGTPKMEIPEWVWPYLSAPPERPS